MINVHRTTSRLPLCTARSLYRRFLAPGRNCRPPCPGTAPAMAVGERMLFNAMTWSPAPSHTAPRCCTAHPFGLRALNESSTRHLCLSCRPPAGHMSCICRCTLHHPCTARLPCNRAVGLSQEYHPGVCMRQGCPQGFLRRHVRTGTQPQSTHSQAVRR